MAQSSMVATKIGKECQNMLHHAYMVYSNSLNFHTQHIIMAVLHVIQRWHGQQNKELRDNASSRKWELDMLTSGTWNLARIVLIQVNNRKHYDEMGIEKTWKPITAVCRHDPRVTSSNDYADMLLGLAVSCARNCASRFVGFLVGFPKRFTLLLSPDRDIAIKVITEFRTHYENWLQLKVVDAEWADKYKERSIFKRPSVMQFVMCFIEENWELSERIASCECHSMIWEYGVGNSICLFIHMYTDR